MGCKRHFKKSSSHRLFTRMKISLQAMKELLPRLKLFMQRLSTILTLVYCGAFFCLGLLLAGLGPSLPSLGRNTGSSDDKMGRTVTSRALGYLTGSLSGPLFHKLPGNRMLAASLLIIAVFCFIIPHMASFVFMCFMFFFQGLGMGMLDTGANLMTLWLHGEGSDPYIQSLHASFAVGAVVGPAIIKALLGGGHPINAAWYMFGGFFAPVVIGLLYFPSPSETHHEDASAQELAITSRSTPTEGEDKPVPLDASLSESLPAQDANSSGQVAAQAPSTRPPSPFNFTWANRYNVDYKPYLMVLGVALFLACYIGGEVATGSFMTTFALRRGLTTEDGGALLATLFWLTFALGRLAAIPISLYVSPRTMIAVDLVGTLISAAFVWVFANRLVPLAIALLAYGAFMASTFPTAITLLQTIIPVTGNMTTVFVVGASLGEMLVPLFVSSNFEKTHYMSLIYTQFFSVVAGTVVMIGVAFLGYKLAQQQRAQEAVLNKLSDGEVQRRSENVDGQDLPPVLYEEKGNTDENVPLDL